MNSAAQQPQPAGLVSKRSYAAVSAAYWAFTLTDGALRMLVLLHFHALGFSPFALASLFVLYEFFGVVTNLGGGMLAARIGLKSTLVAGLTLQIAALGMLSALSDDWAINAQVLYVLVAQGLSGIAKDLTKLSAKSAVKLVLPPDAGEGLFRWVAWLTGSKNTLKGAGFFLGGALLEGVGFERALWGMATALVPVALMALWLLPRAMGRAKSKPAWKRLLAKNAAINWLSASRVFLFGARDLWFVVALPVFLTDELGWGQSEVGAYLASWVIVYGLVQASAPKLLQGAMAKPGDLAAKRTGLVRSGLGWGGALAASALGIYVGVRMGLDPRGVVLGGLALFGVLFAVNSSLHSYLIVEVSDREEVAADVGFYYTANALGRLIGTLGSGWVYGRWGLAACLLCAGMMLVCATALLGGLLRSPSSEADVTDRSAGS